MYNWGDKDYQEFMIKILSNLQPRICFDQDIIYKQGVTINEILLFETGNLDLGYEISRKVIYKIRYRQR